jgi:hypothetical protein|tara:strand:+ start:929 stop:1495 length:567 start_codon:yes stop_codon:yes gene_type:complete
MSSFLNNEKKIISVNISMDAKCNECITDLKKNLYMGRDFSKYTKSKGWIENFFRSDTTKNISYEIVLKKPIFINRNNFYYDKNFNLFFMPTFFEIPKLSIDKIDITNETISQAALIKGELSNLVYLNYSALSGWEVKTKTTIAYIGKTDLLNRLARLKKIIANLEQKNAKPITLDLRYQQGYVLKKFE